MTECLTVIHVCQVLYSQLSCSTLSIRRREWCAFGGKVRPCTRREILAKVAEGFPKVTDLLLVAVMSKNLLNEFEVQLNKYNNNASFTDFQCLPLQGSG